MSPRNRIPAWVDGSTDFSGLVLYSPTKFIFALKMTVSVILWSIRGIHDPLKLTMVSTALQKHLKAICALQETHLTSDTVSYLNFAWVGKVYHSTHTNYFRGVSVLVHHSLDFHELDHSIDTEGRYIFIFFGLPHIYFEMYVSICAHPSSFQW